MKENQIFTDFLFPDSNFEKMQMSPKCKGKKLATFLYFWSPMFYCRGENFLLASLLRETNLLNKKVPQNSMIYTDSKKIYTEKLRIPFRFAAAI